MIDCPEKEEKCHAPTRASNIRYLDYSGFAIRHRAAGTRRH